MKPNVLLAELEVVVITHNISQTPIEQKGVWLMASAPGTPGSRLSRFSLAFDDGQGHVRHFPNRDESELAQLGDDAAQANGPLSVTIEELIGPNHFIEPDSRSIATTKGEVYLLSSGLVPLIHRFPCMGATFYVSGDAVPDLNIQLKSGVASLPASVDDGLTLHFAEPGLLPGATYRLELSVKDGVQDDLLTSQ